MPGFFLPECHDFDAWLESERTSLLEEAVAAAWALAKHLESDSHYTDASRLAKKPHGSIAQTSGRFGALCRCSTGWVTEPVLSTSTTSSRSVCGKNSRSNPSPETVKLAESLRAGRPLAYALPGSAEERLQCPRAGHVAEPDSAFSLICRTRSRVIPRSAPISSSVIASLPSSPK